MGTLGLACQGESRAQGTYGGAQALGRRIWEHLLGVDFERDGTVFRQIFVGVHPGKLTWNPRNGGGWKMIFFLNWVIFGFHVNFQGCIFFCYL